jgi:hypothetical protein
LIFICTLLLLWLLTGMPAFAQKSVRGRKSLPRVDAIGNYDFSIAFAEGCAIFGIRRANPPAEIFMSNGDGSNAWMNLNGRMRQLRHIKTTLLYRTPDGEPSTVYEYRFGRTRIFVSLGQFKESASSEYPAKIILQNGRAKRTINAAIEPQCD